MQFVCFDIFLIFVVAVSSVERTDPQHWQNISVLIKFTLHIDDKYFDEVQDTMETREENSENEEEISSEDNTEEELQGWTIFLWEKESS